MVYPNENLLIIIVITFLLLKNSFYNSIINKFWYRYRTWKGLTILIILFYIWEYKILLLYVVGVDKVLPYQVMVDTLYYWYDFVAENTIVRYVIDILSAFLLSIVYGAIAKKVLILMEKKNVSFLWYIIVIFIGYGIYFIPLFLNELFGRIIISYECIYIMKYISSGAIYFFHIIFFIAELMSKDKLLKS